MAGRKITLIDHAISVTIEQPGEATELEFGDTITVTEEIIVGPHGHITMMAVIGTTYLVVGRPGKSYYERCIQAGLTAYPAYKVEAVS